MQSFTLSSVVALRVDVLPTDECRKAGLNCTDLCSCSDEGVESCDNVDIDGDSDIEYSDNDEDTEEENDD